MTTFTRLNVYLFASALTLGGFAAILPAQAEVINVGNFEMVDTDGDGYVTDTEYSNHSYSVADDDRDGYVEEEEYNRYTKAYYDPYDVDYDSFGDYDANGDGYINEAEYANVPTRDMYGAYDANGDARIDTNEWDDVTTYYTDYE